MATKKKNPFEMKVKTSSNMLTALGITSKRSDQLRDLTLKGVDGSGGKISAIMANASKYCKNPNELALCVYTVARAAADHERHEKKIRALLGHILGK